jgi:hypothetical protein
MTTPDGAENAASPSADDEAQAPSRTSDLLLYLADRTQDERIYLGDLLDILRDRAFGIVLVILALPCALPFLYGVPQVISLPMLFVTVQVALGRRTLWLPDALRRRSFSRAGFSDMVRRGLPLLRRLERLSHPRLMWLARSPFDRLIGVFLVLFSISIAVPLPLTNTTPGIAVAIVSIGFIERDGVLVLGGTVLGTAWIAFLLTIAGGLAAGLAWLAGVFG